ncbi:MAG: methylated-DNA--[protein]-cysteine S-methyltransferase [Gammaproteobacteria bacterium]
MSTTGYTLFDTAIGPCGMAWNDAGVTAVQLPELTPAATLARLANRFPALAEASPRGAARRARDAICAHLDGRQRDLGAIELDFTGLTTFRRQLYTAARRIPPGQTVTYGELAARIGAQQSARAVGQAMGANPYPVIVPCHRVLAAGGRAGGFSAAGGATTKAWMLRIEGAREVPFEGFEYDLFEAVQHLRKADPRLAGIIDQVGPPKIALRHTASIFLALARAIVYQQLSGKAAATIFGRVCALFPRGERDFTARNLLALPSARLREAGLSNNKLLALTDLAERSLAGEVPTLAQLRQMDDETAIAALTRVRGIGRWTVEMMLMFRLGRGDVMAVDDLGLRQGHAILMGRRGETERKALAAYAERWRPYRSVASWYLWRAVELARARP